MSGESLDIKFDSGKPAGVPGISCHGVPGLRNQVSRRTKIRWGGKRAGFRLRLAGFGKTKKLKPES
jgi:hypothetical protein